MTWYKQEAAQGVATSFEKKFKGVDLDGFTKELLHLEKEVRQSSQEDDLRHLKKIILWQKACTAFGLLTGMLIPNPISAFLIGQGKFTRWATVAHHVLHKGYDNFSDSSSLNSKKFAKGWRRYLDWNDWIEPAAWEKEHNVLHHYRLGERFDPDIFEDNVVPARIIKAPRWVKFIVLFVVASQWKWFYYAPSTIKQLFSPKKKDSLNSYYDRLVIGDKTFWPWFPEGRKLWFKSYLPYIALNFILIPAVFLLYSQTAAVNVFWTMLMAEVLTNLQSFLTIVPNHTGGDLYRFQGAPKDRQEFFIRQIVGSVNYRCGGDLNDFLHGWLNYQIEHHVWPDLNLRQYQQIQPRLKELCQRYGIPYIQESVWRRLWKLTLIFTGEETMMSMSGKLKESAEPALSVS